MADAAFPAIRACVFDAYGTLFDVNAPVARVGGRLGEMGARLSAIWRQKQLEYTWLRSLMGLHADFWEVTGDALDFALADCGVDDPPLREALMEAYLTLDAYDDAGPALDRLRVGGLTTAILSNGSPRMLEAATAHAGLDPRLDAILSIETAGIYKPHPASYRVATDALDLPAEAICFVSTNAWDVAGASAFGFRVAWLNRFARTPERLPAGPHATIEGLDRLPGLVLA
ncbi:MAG: haloacid dehalogenase type II [Azospirillaceae bacterium]